ncbi:histidine kinase [Halomonas binhaiensis]|uniref:Sensor protein n=1 Tax=Halomonas binhaiensis TaxID=2562282 RepID=A0A5C1ND15_9GAMM|nr:histidine kinase [Halomonas binhaiensis]QEM81572.1 HAMP domain-containing protein [Halomonas binhaiensis]
MAVALSLRRSLMLRVLLVITVISSLALLSIFGSIFVVVSSVGVGDAIDKSSSLRMHAYRLMVAAEHLPLEHPQRIAQMEDMQALITAPALLRFIPEQKDNAMHKAYQDLVDTWKVSLYPILSNYEAGEYKTLKKETDEFIEKVDVLVIKIKERISCKVLFLEAFQGGILIILALVIGLFFYHFIVSIMPPFRDLVRVVEGVMLGDFSGRTTYQGGDEIGLLSRTINRMNVSLSEKYGQLKNRVAAKTQELKLSNDALRMLYLTARRLNGITPLTHEELIEVLRQLGAVTHEGPFELYLIVADNPQEMVCLSSEGDEPHVVSAMPNVGTANEYAVRVCEADRDYGELRVMQPSGQILAQWKIELIETVAGLIAAAISLSEKANKQRRLALMDERAVIARELHDSLAQSLSYLKIQVTRLQVRLDQQRHDEVSLVVGELRHGLNSSYRQLRELLNTFRLRIHEAGLEAAMKETVAEYSRRGDFNLSLKGQWNGLFLTPNEEIHVLQIVREALSNVARHSKARHCEVSLEQNELHQYQLSIRDDGIGVGQSAGSSMSHGMTIMEERARSLCGTLSIGAALPYGTVITVCFLPRGFDRLSSAIG